MVGTPFFGIGAMRTGTTWLSELLRSYPDCAVMPIKEMHFFDVRHGNYGFKYYRDKTKMLAAWSQKAQERVESVLEKMRAGDQLEDDDHENDASGGIQTLESAWRHQWSDEARRHFLERTRLNEYLQRISRTLEALSIWDLQSYVEYVKRHGSGARAFGEITTTYCVLSAAAFSEMDRALPHARFLFVMRDPVERLWSHARYRRSNLERHHGKERDALKNFNRALKGGHAHWQSNYRRTIEALESVVPRDRIVYLFTETMTSPEQGPTEILKVEQALGLTHREIDRDVFVQAVNASPAAALEPESEAAAVRAFTHIYEYVERRFGRRDGWRSPADFT